jgi:hypothetical protein
MVVRSLPRSASGKVDMAKVRELAREVLKRQSRATN